MKIERYGYKLSKEKLDWVFNMYGIDLKQIEDNLSLTPEGVKKQIKNDRKNNLIPKKARPKLFKITIEEVR